MMLKIEIEDRGCYYLVVIQSMEVKGDKKNISLTQSTVPGMQIYMCTFYPQKVADQGHNQLIITNFIFSVYIATFVPSYTC